MPLPDCRIRLPGPPINFSTDVGDSGQDHDGYPGAGDQLRFDWMRMFLIGLLANQASYNEPTQYRDGSIWFDLNQLVFKVRRDGRWDSLAAAIAVDTATDGSTVTLADMFDTLRNLLAVKPLATFSGQVASNTNDVIPIPEQLRPAAGTGTRPLVWRNGNLLDPRRCDYIGAPMATAIRTTELVQNDTFTVLITAVASQFFYIPDVII
jgi:hypothetical protein